MKVFAWLGAGFVAWMVLLTFALSSALSGAGAATQGGVAHVDDIPDEFLALYQAAGERFKLDWLWLAAVGKVETDHDRMSPGCETSSAGARGPMQFMPATWKTYGVDGDVCNPHDAIFAAARYLKANGAPGDWHEAILAYNHAEWYYNKVSDQRREYAAAALAASTTGRGGGIGDLVAEADRMVSLGQPYTWGGGHLAFDPNGPWDCSGAISWLLHYLGLLDGAPLASWDLAKVGAPGRGDVFTIYANDAHVFLIVETGAHRGDAWGTATRDLEGAQGSGPLWHHHATSGFVARHYPGW